MAVKAECKLKWEIQTALTDIIIFNYRN
jgi:hypothetical protein